MSRPILLTRRLRLDPIEAADVDELWALFGDAEVRRYLFDDVAPPRDRVEGFVELSDRLFADHGAGLWCVRERDGTGAIVGLAGYFWFHEQLELLYALSPARWGCGYATEASLAALGYGFDVCGFERVVASTDAPNAASVQVMERLSMRFDKRETIDGLDTVFYSAGRDDLERSGPSYDLLEEAP